MAVKIGINWFRKQETRNKKQETRNKKQETGNRKNATRKNIKRKLSCFLIPFSPVSK